MLSPTTDSSDEFTDDERALATLWFYFGRFVTLELDPGEREALDDAVDKVNQHESPGDFEPLRCWWRDDTPLEWDPKHA